MKLDFSNLRILVIGDFMIDHYIMGSSNRISPEAPVPVVIPNDEFSIHWCWECRNESAIAWFKCVL